MAVTSRLIRESDGREKLAVSLGQIQYFEDSRVGLSSGTPVLESGRSAWVADATYAVNDRWTIGASYQWDPKFGRQDLAKIGRASCRERVCQYGLISVVAVALKK